MSGDRRLVVLFGSQTGNSEGIGFAKTVKMASAYGLDAELHDMDGFAFDSLTSAKRVLIVTSTWGEGEMPDNAETLWGTANKADAPRLEGTHFTVCALGDTGYDEFCKAGLDWDERLEGLGAQRAHDIVLCDVDYEPPWATWVVEALTRLACVDDSGTLQVELLEAMRDHATGSADEEDAGDLAMTPVAQRNWRSTYASSGTIPWKGCMVGTNSRRCFCQVTPRSRTHCSTSVDTSTTVSPSVAHLTPGRIPRRD